MKLIYFFKCNAFKFSLVQSDSSSLFIYMYVCMYLHKYINIYVYMCRNIYLSVNFPFTNFSCLYKKKYIFLNLLPISFSFLESSSYSDPFGSTMLFSFYFFFSSSACKWIFCSFSLLRQQFLRQLSHRLVLW